MSYLPMILIDKHYHLEFCIINCFLLILKLGGNDMVKKTKDNYYDPLKRNDAQKEEQWDKRSRGLSDRNFILGNKTYGNPFNNTDNPNWQNQMFEVGVRPSKLNDPQRIQKQNRVEDNNSNINLLKD